MNRLVAPLRGLGVAVGIGAALAGGLQAQQPVEAIRFDSDAIEIDLGGRVQTQFNTTTAEDEPFSELFIRRARLELSVRLNEIVSGRIQPEFAGNRVDLKDVYLQLDFSPAFQVLTGQAYKPFSLLEQTSSTRMLPIERGARIRGVEAWDEYELVNELEYSDRDIGIQVLGEPAGAPLGLAYQAGVFRGPLHGAIGDESSYQYAARLTVTPLEDLTLGAGWSSRDFVDAAVDPALALDLERGNAFEVDLEFGSFDPGVHILAEVAFGDADPFTGREFFGSQAWFGYRTGAVGLLSAVEPIFRASYGDLDPAIVADGSLGGTLLTPGLNLYFGGRNRVMFNYDFWSPEEGEAEGSFKAMFQLAF